MLLVVQVSVTRPTQECIKLAHNGDLEENLGGRVQSPVQPYVKMSENTCGVPFKFGLVRLCLVV
jgi:hypothetical protein